MHVFESYMYMQFVFVNQSLIALVDICETNFQNHLVAKHETKISCEWKGVECKAVQR